MCNQCVVYTVPVIASLATYEYIGGMLHRDVTTFINIRRHFIPDFITRLQKLATMHSTYERMYEKYAYPGNADETTQL